MSIFTELRATSRLGLLVGGTTATVGVIYVYDPSNIAGALLSIKDEFDLSSRQEELVTTAVVVGEVTGAVIGGAVTNALGRRKSMLIVAFTYAAFALLSAVSTSIPKGRRAEAGRGGDGQAPRRRRRATYKRTAGVPHLMAGYNLTRDRIYGHIKPVKDRRCPQSPQQPRHLGRVRRAQQRRVVRAAVGGTEPRPL